MGHTRPMTDPLRPVEHEALAAWARRVRRNREQVERHRAALAPGSDFYAPIASWFKVDPRRTDDDALNALLALVGHDETVLDIGAGGGRYALPLALHAREVIAVEPSEGMRGVLQEGKAEHGIANIRLLDERWPSPALPAADIAFIAHVGYDIEEFGPFLDAMERAASRLCVALMLSRPPAGRADPFWEAVHGEAREPLPALPEFLALQLARGRLCEVQLVEYSAGVGYDTIDDALSFLRQQLWIAADSPQDERLREVLPRHVRQEAGRVTFASDAGVLGLVRWQPLPAD